MIKLASALAIVASISIVPASAWGAATIDRSFGDSGVATIPINESGYVTLGAKAVAEQSNGSLVALANESFVYSKPNYRIDLMTVGRFKANGRPDRTFGKGGSTKGSSYSGEGFVGYGNDLAVTRRGRIFATGPFMPTYVNLDNWTGNCMVLSRYRPSGLFDLGFAHSGITYQCLHKGWVAPENVSAATNTRTWRADRLPTVGLDSRSIDLTGEGKILVGGMTLRNWSEQAAFVARFHQNGKLDRSFKGGKSTRSGEKGIVEIRRTPKVGGEKRVTQVLALRRAKVLAVGELRGSIMVSRLRRNGSLDTTFGQGGVVKPELPEGITCCSSAEAAAIDHRGRILVAGEINDGSMDFQPVIFRLRKDGRLDRRFGKDGFALPEIPGSTSGYDPPIHVFRPTAMTVQKDGRIVIAGNYNWNFGLMRLARNGELDPEFFDDGLVDARSEIGLGGGIANDVIIDHRGRIVAAGLLNPSGMDLIRIFPGK